MQARLAAVLGDDRVHLTPLRIENIYTHYRWNNDPELCRFDSEMPFEKEAFADFKRRFLQMALHPQPDACDFEIHRVADGALIGVAFIDRIDTFHRRCRIGLAIAEPSAQGLGYGRATLDVLLRCAFDELKMHRVVAEAFSFAHVWNGLLDSAGFESEGRLRDYLFREGTYHDKVTYALLEEEYSARQTSRPVLVEAA
ncbi:MAG: GNAT family protein [Bacteroidota bacterium]